MNIFLGYLLTYIYVFLILIVLGLMKKKRIISGQTSRKLIHILMGFTWIVIAYFFKTSIHMIILPITMVIFNFISYKFNIIKSMEQENKDSKGTIYYALSFVILATITYFYPPFLPYYGIGVFTLSIGDGIAPFIGKKWNKYKIAKTNKTYAGSLIVLLCTILVVSIFSSYYHLDLNIIKIVLLGLISIPLELINIKGSDNLTLPIGISLIAFFLEGWF